MFRVIITFYMNNSLNCVCHYEPQRDTIIPISAYNISHTGAILCHVSKETSLYTCVYIFIYIYLFIYLCVCQKRLHITWSSTTQSVRILRTLKVALVSFPLSNFARSPCLYLAYGWKNVTNCKGTASFSGMMTLTCFIAIHKLIQCIVKRDLITRTRPWWCQDISLRLLKRKRRHD
jgi:hypothetical protein